MRAENMDNEEMKIIKWDTINMGLNQIDRKSILRYCKVEWKELEETVETRSETFGSWPHVGALAGPKSLVSVVWTDCVPRSRPEQARTRAPAAEHHIQPPHNPEQFCVIDIGALSWAGWRVEHASTSHGKVKGVGPVWAGDHRLNK